MAEQGESILNSVKAVVNLTDDNTDFDTEIIIHVNAAFSNLHQLGVGPNPQFRITSKDETWEQFIDGVENIDSVKALVGLKVKLAIDSSTMTSYAINATQEVIKEYEFRLMVSQEEVRYPWQAPLHSSGLS